MNLQIIEEKLGYTFQNKNLLKIALTHASYANEHGGQSYERMEFLGDSVIQFVVTEELYQRGNFNEGVMTAQRQKIVSAEPLERAVKKISLDSFVLGVGGIGKKGISSVFESVTAAIYLDGGMEKAKKFVLTHLSMEAEVEVNYKGKLQELMQAKGLLPTYTTLDKMGEDHDPVFRCQVEADGIVAVGQGKNKRQAEQNAAKAVLERMKG